MSAKRGPKRCRVGRGGRGTGGSREGIDATIERSIDRLGGANCNWQLAIWVRGHNAIGAFSCPVGPSKRPFWLVPSAQHAPCGMLHAACPLPMLHCATAGSCSTAIKLKLRSICPADIAGHKINNFRTFKSEYNALQCPLLPSPPLSSSPLATHCGKLLQCNPSTAFR